MGMETVTTNLAILDEHFRSHIDKENDVLFPMADKVLTPVDQQALLASFEKRAWDIYLEERKRLWLKRFISMKKNASLAAPA
jgi:hemerythrin-like domain-containing protein